MYKQDIVHGGNLGLLTAKITGEGLAYTGRCLIHWISIEPSTTYWNLELVDGVASGTVKWSMSDPVQKAFHASFSEPREMLTGIFVEELTSCHAVIGYIPVPD